MFRYIAVAALLIVTPARAQDNEPAYLDNGSTPQLLVESFYNAISRFEIGRAWSYLNPDVRPDYPAFFALYEHVSRATPTIGELTSTARAGEIFYDVPVVVELVDDQGARSYAAGCLSVGWPLPDKWNMDPYPMPYVNHGGLQRVEGTTADTPPVCD